jgi:hypothetical protein
MRLGCVEETCETRTPAFDPIRRDNFALAGEKIEMANKQDDENV